MDYRNIIRHILLVYVFMSNSILSSVCLPSLTSGLVFLPLLPTLSDHITPRTEEEAGSHNWGHHHYSSAGEYWFEWGKAPDHRCSVALDEAILCRVTEVVNLTSLHGLLC